MSTSVTNLSGYRLMRILAMFDLPTDTKSQRRAATEFRNVLLDEGFGRSLPDAGDVQVLNFTDRQYRDIVEFSNQGQKRARENPKQLVIFLRDSLGHPR